MAAESARLEELFRSACKLWWKRHSWWLHKFHADKYSGKGIPDFLGSWRGISFGCEIKSQHDRPSQEQRGWADVHRSVYTFCVKEHDGTIYFVPRDEYINYSLRRISMWQRLDMYQARGESGVVSLPRLDLIEAALCLHRGEVWKERS